MSSQTVTALMTTPLHALHQAHGAKLVEFGGYDMPVHYTPGVLKEHLHCRAKAGLFDVSHMGQIHLRGPDAVAGLEALVPADIAELGQNQTRYTMFTTQAGGIIDDIMVTRLGPEHLFLVVNAGGKMADLAHLKAHLAGVDISYLADQALLAIQGPVAAAIMAEALPETDLATIPFMSGMSATLYGAPAYITRSGYTGEDGFEISLPAAESERIAVSLLQHPDLLPIGLGARDSLRLEAGLCLHGHDIDTSTTPVEAGLTWSLGKRRRTEGEFAGSDIIQQQLSDGATRKRVGLLPLDRTPAREGTAILDAGGNIIGTVTSGGFSPTLDRPIAMGYVPSALAAPGTALYLSVRGRQIPASVVRLPFVPHNYHRILKGE